jgi:phosphoribosylformylglycinamidine synthase
MKNDARLGGVKISVPPTLLVSAIGQIDDVRRAVTLDFKEPGDALFVLGETGAHTGGSEYYRHLGERDGRGATQGEPAGWVGNAVPTVDPERAMKLYAAFSEAVADGLVRSAATPAKGGLAVALARSAMAGELGCEAALEDAPGAAALDDDELLFAESNSRFVVTVAAEDAEAFAQRLRGQPCRCVGHVTAEPQVLLKRDGSILVEADIDALKTRYKQGLAHA